TIPVAIFLFVSYVIGLSASIPVGEKRVVAMTKLNRLVTGGHLTGKGRYVRECSLSPANSSGIRRQSRCKRPDEPARQGLPLVTYYVSRAIDLNSPSIKNLSRCRVLFL